MTNDYSVGLFEEDVNDIYHSAFGALSEAYEKFVNPAKEVFNFSSLPDNFRVLDICYGIGYNTKAFLQEVINYNHKNVFIDCVDTDKNLIVLSPFISTRVNFFDRVFNKREKLINNVINYKDIKKFIFSYKRIKNPYKIHNFINQVLLKSLIKNFGEDFLTCDTRKILSKHENYIFFDSNILQFYKFLSKNEDELYQIKNKLTFVHNIYYEYITKRNINKRFNDINIAFHAKDIRYHLKESDDIRYNLVFLDGFTPSKCPCIWSLDFFHRLYTVTSTDGIVVTYNKSAPVRNAMLQAGFYIGNTFDADKKIVGTIAAKNSSYIKHHISSKDKGLLNTKAGIPYRDYNLSLENDKILLNREYELSESNLLSSSKYLKEHNNEI